MARMMRAGKSPTNPQLLARRVLRGRSESRLAAQSVTLTVARSLWFVRLARHKLGRPSSSPAESPSVFIQSLSVSKTLMDGRF